MFSILRYILRFRSQISQHVQANGRPDLRRVTKFVAKPADLKTVTSVMERCWSQAPHQRPTAEGQWFEALQHITSANIAVVDTMYAYIDEQTRLVLFCG